MTVKKTNADPFEVINTSIEQLDDEMNSHKDNCLRCIQGAQCKTWIDLVESYNFYNLAMRRYIRNNKELTNAEEI
jgi:hypothetical protein